MRSCHRNFHVIVTCQVASLLLARETLSDLLGIILITDEHF